jgi:hypothetical protein
MAATIRRRFRGIGGMSRVSTPERPDGESAGEKRDLLTRRRPRSNIDAP